ncbi:MAG: HlyD family secretion protein, partial [Steroidobacteraceae bacterium]
MSVRRKNLGISATALVVAAAAVAAAYFWLWRQPSTNQLVVSGDIEAHESVLSFKSVQSRIVELPFD